MEDSEVIIEQSRLEPGELSAAYLDMTALYEWLDRPVTDEDDELTG